MNPEKLVEAFGRGLAQGFIGAAIAEPPPQALPPRRTRPAAPPARPPKAPPAQAPASDAQQTLPFEQPLPDLSASGDGVAAIDEAVASTNGRIVAPPISQKDLDRFKEIIDNPNVTDEQLEEIDFVLKHGKPRNVYVPEDTEGDQPWKA